MKKLLLPIVIFLTAFSLFQVASAQVSGSLWKLGSNNLIPVNSSWGLKIPYFGTNGTLCLQTDNNGLIGTSSAACGSGGGGGDPFTHTSVYGQTTSATSTLLSLTGSLFSLVASSTVEFVNASTTALTVSGTSFLADAYLVPANNLPAIFTSQIASGVPTANVHGSYFSSNYAFNQLSMTDNVDSAGGSGTTNTAGLMVFDNVNGASASGNHIGISGQVYLNGTVKTAGNYVGLWGFVNSGVNVGGTPAVTAGQVFGSNPQVVLTSGATNYTNAVGEEVDNEVRTGASVQNKIGINITTAGSDTQQGTSTDAGLLIGATGSSPGWLNGILFSNFNTGVNPVSTTGTLIRTGSAFTVVHGIDFSSSTCSADCFKSNNFIVLGSGSVGIGMISPVTLLSNTSAAMTDTSGNGISSVGLTWGTPLNTGQSSYIMGVRNPGVAAGNRNGLLVQTAATDSGSFPLRVESGLSTPVAVFTAAGTVGIATTTPFWALTAASSSGPQLALVDTTNSSNAWTFRSISNTLFIATSTATATSTTAALALDPNGIATFGNIITTPVSIGIRSSAPTIPLDVRRNSGALLPSISGGTAAVFSGTANQAGSNEITVLAGNTAIAALFFGDKDAETQGQVSYDNNADAMSFFTNNGQRAIINSSGNVGIATTTPQWALTASNATLPQLALVDTTSSSSAWTFRSINSSLFIATSTYSATSTKSAVRIDKNGAVYLPSAGVSSSNQTGYWCYDANDQLIQDSAVCIAVSARRFKQDIQPLDVGLNELLRLNPVSYKLKPDWNILFKNNPNYNGTQEGFIADDVQKVDPRLVTVETSTTTFEGKTYAPGTVHGLSDFSNWTAVIVSSIQDFYGQFQALVGRVSGLEAKVNAQQKQIDRLQAEIDALKH